MWTDIIEFTDESIDLHGLEEVDEGVVCAIIINSCLGSFRIEFFVTVIYHIIFRFYLRSGDCWISLPGLPDGALTET